MSDENQNNKKSIFSNEDTIVRRAWIESAVQGARSSLTSVPPDAAPLADVAAPLDHDVGPQGPYLAWSGGRRCSGT